MQVETTNSVISTNQVSNENSIQKSSLNLFDSLLSKNTPAKNITYDEYKNLSVEDLEKLFPKQSMPEENEKALSLHTKAQASEDEILNQVLFDKELEFYGSDAQQYVSSFVDSSVKFWDALKEPLEIKPEHLGLANIPVSNEPVSAEYLKQVELDRQKSLELAKENKLTAEALFDFFAHMKMDYNQNKEYYKNSESTFRKHGQEILGIYDGIQREYEKRVAQNDEALKAHTTNSINRFVI